MYYIVTKFSQNSCLTLLNLIFLMNFFSRHSPASSSLWAHLPFWCNHSFTPTHKAFHYHLGPVTPFTPVRPSGQEVRGRSAPARWQNHISNNRCGKNSALKWWARVTTHYHQHHQPSTTCSTTCLCLSSSVCRCFSSCFFNVSSSSFALCNSLSTCRHDVTDSLLHNMTWETTQNTSLAVMQQCVDD